MKEYKHLTNPIQIGDVTIKNRMFMAPMDTGFGNTKYDVFTQAGIDYWHQVKSGA